MASRFSPGKGHEEFLRAAKILTDEFKDEISFLIAGSASFGEEDYREKIQQMAGELGLNDAVKFTGYSSDIAGILSAMDIFVLPSHEESFGILLTEAMAMGLPVAASNNAGVPDIVTDNETGILVPPKNERALASALKKLILSSELRTSLGKAGRKRAEGIFNIDTALDKLEKFYAG
jgi:glycosyltransferase involved in cell wall biosynthesis